MDPLFWFNVITRWLHVTCAVVGIGAFVFWRLVLMPALAAQEPGARQALAARLAPRLKTLVHSALGLLLLTGFYNYSVAIPKVRTLAYRSLYHPIIGTKILLALVLFGIATALLSSRSGSGNIGEERSGGLTLILVLAIIILFLSAILRRLWA
jgi:uncharacterized membrane protein